MGALIACMLKSRLVASLGAIHMKVEQRVDLLD